MKKILLPKAGESSIFQVVEAESPKISKQNQVLIKTHYSGLNFADIMMRLGLYPDAPAFPFSPGYEVSGVVKAVGEEVEGFQVGDQVIGGCYFNGYSSEVLLEDWQVTALPKNLSLEQGGAVLVSYLTAYMVFFELARLRNGDKVLIDCASGSLGQLSMQMFKGMDLDVVGLTSSSNKKAFLKDLGFRPMTHEEFASSDERGFHVALNSLGGKSIEEHYQRLAPGGRIVCIGASSFVVDGKRNLFRAIKGMLQMPRKSAVSLMNDNKGIMGLNALRLFEEPELLKRILAQLSRFELNPVVDKVFPYQEVGKAHEYLEQKKARGKVLLGWA